MKYLLSVFALMLTSSALAADYSNIYLPAKAEADLASIEHLITITPLSERIENDKLLGSNGAYVNPLRNIDSALRSIEAVPDAPRQAAIKRLRTFIDETVRIGNETGYWVIYGTSAEVMRHFTSTGLIYGGKK